MTALDAATVDALADALAERIAHRVVASPLVDAEAAGVQLGVPGTWLLAEARANRVPHVRLGRYVRFSREQLAAWTDEQVRGPRITARTSSVGARGRNLRSESC